MSEMNESNGQIELPAGTVWPLVFALGIALVMTGFVSSVWVSAAGGALWLVASIGWWRNVFPGERHITVAVGRDTRTGPAPVSVDRIRVGQKGHRIRRPTPIKPFSAGLRGGVVGAIGMAGVAMLFGIVSQNSIWYPINLLAAAALPDLASASVEQLRQFSASGLILGTIIHVLTSYLVGVVYAVMLPMFPSRAFWWAGITAPVLWTGIIASSLEFVNPALNSRIDWKWFVASQLAFGLTGGYVIAQAESIEELENIPLSVRAGIETPGVRDATGESGESQ